MKTLQTNFMIPIGFSAYSVPGFRPNSVLGFSSRIERGFSARIQCRFSFRMPSGLSSRIQIRFSSRIESNSVFSTKVIPASFYHQNQFNFTVKTLRTNFRILSGFRARIQCGFRPNSVVKFISSRIKRELRADSLRF